VVVLDGWDHMRPLPDYKEGFAHEGHEDRRFTSLDQVESSDYRRFVELYDSDTEEDEDLEEKAAAKAKAEQERVEE